MAFGNCCSGVAYCFVFAKLRYCACGFNYLPFSSYAFNQNKAKERVKKFESQLSDALIIACSCLKSGLSFTQAMETIAKDMDDPISGEFALVIKEMSMGASMEEALDKLNTRIKSKHLALMVSAVLVQRQTGGNLSQILENISNTIKERMKLQQELKSATASGKMSGTVVGMMPIAICLCSLL